MHNIPEVHTSFGRDIIYYNVLKYEAEAVSSPRFIQPSNCIQFRTVEIVISNLRAERADITPRVVAPEAVFDLALVLRLGLFGPS